MLVLWSKSMILSEIDHTLSKVSLIFSVYSFENNIPSVYPLHDNISLWDLKLSSYFLKDN